MSRVPVSQRSVDVDNSFFPRPATKLIITQYLECEDISCWAWIIVGTFFDSHDRPLWSTEIFLARFDHDSDSESGYSESESESESDSTDAYDQALEHSWSGDEPAEESQESHDWAAADAYPEQYPPSNPITIHTPPGLALYLQPPIWEPVAYGPIPGHWEARFDPNISRWIHTWQPHF
ncbi:hypothetical protein E4U54_004248 [Claviceps lovelessii]|nr:hypothetical protein E4U54_004248 [Claviceps lovelessii]